MGPRTMHVAVDGRAGLVDSLDDPTFTLTADTETFVMLACGRVDPQARIDAGRISWTGDPNGARRRPATSASRCKAQPASAIPA